MKESFAGWRHIAWEPGKGTGLLEGSLMAFLKKSTRVKIPRIIFHYEKRQEDTNILDTGNGTFKRARVKMKIESKI